MAKQTKTNSNGKEGKILEDQTSTAPAPQAPIGENRAKQKKRQELDVILSDSAGKTVEFTDEAGAILTFQTRAGEFTLDTTKLSPAIMHTAALFGLKTTLQNTHNSAANDKANGDGPSALKSRLENLLAGQWRKAGEGNGGDDSVPIVIEAMTRVKIARGLSQAEAQTFYDAKVAEYRQLSKDAKAEWRNAYAKQGPVAVAIQEITAERAAAKLAKMQAAQSAGAIDF